MLPAVIVVVVILPDGENVAACRGLPGTSSGDCFFEGLVELLMFPAVLGRGGDLMALFSCMFKANGL